LITFTRPISPHRYVNGSPSKSGNMLFSPPLFLYNTSLPKSSSTNQVRIVSTNVVSIVIYKTDWVSIANENDTPTEPHI